MKIIKKLSILFLVLITATNCTKDDVGEIVEISSKTYQVQPFEGSSVSGTAKIIKNSNGTIAVKMNLSGTSSSATLPVHIHFNSAAEGGEISISLISVDGETGLSETTFNTQDDGTQVTYEQLMNMDAHLVVHADTNNSTILALADIGQNELTQNSISYPLQEANLAGVTGNITFSERLNGEALATINLSGLPAGGLHPAHIYTGDLANAPGSVLFTFNRVNGTTGQSFTNVSEDENGNPFMYQDIYSVDAYVDVILSYSSPDYHLAQGNIGANY